LSEKFIEVKNNLIGFSFRLVVNLFMWVNELSSLENENFDKELKEKLSESLNILKEAIQKYK